AENTDVRARLKLEEGVLEGTRMDLCGIQQNVEQLASQAVQQHDLLKSAVASLQVSQVYITHLEEMVQKNADTAAQQTAALSQSALEVQSLAVQLRSAQDLSNKLTQEVEAKNKAIAAYAAQVLEDSAQILSMDKQIMQFQKEEQIREDNSSKVQCLQEQLQLAIREKEDVEAKVDGLEAEVADLHLRIPSADIEQENQHLRQAVQELETEVNDGRKSVLQLQQALSDLKEERARMNAEIAARDKMCQEKDGLLYEMQCQLSETVSDHQRVHEGTASSLASKATEIAELGKRVGDLKDKLTAAIKKGKRIEVGKKEAEAQLAQLQQVVSALEEQQVKELEVSTSLKERALRAEAEVEKLEGETKELQRVTEDRSAATRDAGDRVQMLECELERAKLRASQAEKDVQKLESEAAAAGDLSRKMDALAAQAEQGEAMLRRNEIEMAAMREEVATHKNKVSMARDAIEKLRKERQAAKGEVEEFSSRVEYLLAENDQLREALSEARMSEEQDSPASATVLEEWKRRAEEAEQNAEIVGQRLQDAERELGDISARLAQHQAAEDATATRIATLDHELAQRNAELDQMRRSQATTASNRIDEESTRRRLQEEADALRHERDVLTRELEQARQSGPSTSQVTVDIMPSHDHPQGSLTQVKRREIVDLESNMPDEEDHGSDGERESEFRPLTSLAFVRSASTHPRITHAVSQLDRWTVTAGKALTGRPLLRIGLLAYAALLHIIFFARLLA
ncbi:unnamed protein product, partial [Ostreobium quekettii]